MPTQSGGRFVGETASGGRAIAHRAGGERVRDPEVIAAAPRARMFYVGHPAYEPTLGITKRGSVFFTAASPTLGPVDVMRSTNEGNTWKVVSPKVGGHNAHPFSMDPYLYVDPTTSRVYTVDLIPCPVISYSDDEGASWIMHPFPCEQFDHQTLFAGPPVVSATVGYPN
ncbi:MAG TPA: hypothetical protein VG408_07150, partial [Actinomycetota bacterium]|nr:hypothetical protein [Actinomycetota bacterium]